MNQTDLRSLHAHATHLTETGQFEVARQAWLNLLALAPDSTDILLELSYLESLAGQHRAAHDWCVRAAEAPKHSLRNPIAFIRRLRTFNQVPRLCSLATDLLAIPQPSEGALQECARQLSNLDVPDLALQCAEHACTLAPNDLGARILRAQIWADFGRIDEAERELATVLATNPRYSIAWWMLARLKRQTHESNHIPTLLARLKDPGLRPPDIASLARALHKECDDLDDVPLAWAALERMCQARRRDLDYHATHTRCLVDALIASTAGLATTEVPHAATTPIFVLGMHRSGTSLLEQLLAGHPQIRALGELSDFTHAMRYATDHYCKGTIDEKIVTRAHLVDWADVGTRYIDGLSWRLDGHSHFIDKEPSNFLNIGFICRALPQAKILHMVRDPVETCFSNLRELFSGINAHTYDQVEMAEYFIQYRRLMAHWHMAFPERILDVSYAELTRDAEATMQKVAAFCRIEFQPSMVDPRHTTRAVATASAIQVREAITHRKHAKWLPYSQYLRPLITTLRDGGIELSPEALQAIA